MTEEPLGEGRGRGAGAGARRRWGAFDGNVGEREERAADDGRGLALANHHFQAAGAAIAGDERVVRRIDPSALTLAMKATRPEASMTGSLNVLKVTPERPARGRRLHEEIVADEMPAPLWAGSNGVLEDGAFHLPRKATWPASLMAGEPKPAHVAPVWMRVSPPGPAFGTAPPLL